GGHGYFLLGISVAADAWRIHGQSLGRAAGSQCLPFLLGAVRCRMRAFANLSAIPDRQISAGHGRKRGFPSHSGAARELVPAGGTSPGQCLLELVPASGGRRFGAFHRMAPGICWVEKDADHGGRASVFMAADLVVLYSGPS